MGVFVLLVVFLVIFIVVKARFYRQCENGLRLNESFLYEEEFRRPYEEFDEIHDCTVEVRLIPRMRMTMSARPDYCSLFFGKNNRRYLILVNENLDWSKIPELARVGLFAHELAHIKDYEKMGLVGLLRFAWSYLFDSGRRRTERRIDGLVIQAGFASELYEWAKYSFTSSAFAESYRDLKKKYYMLPEEVHVHILD